MISYIRHSGDVRLRLDGLLDESELEGFRFLRRLIDDWESGAHRFDSQGEILIVCIENDQVIAVGGLTLDPYAEDPQVDRIRHVYVARSLRRCGIGRSLVEQLMDHARNNYRSVRLRTDTLGGDHFYRSLGFSLMTNCTSATHWRQL